MKQDTINVKEYIKNSITDELNYYIENGNIEFNTDENKEEFIKDCTENAMETYRNNYSCGKIVFPDAEDIVSDAIKYDYEYYGIELIDF